MQQAKRILYVGTYEREYPRNVTVIAALQGAGYDVCEVHRTVWSASGDKSALVSSPHKLIGLGLRCGAAYLSLSWELIRKRNETDLVTFGYIGQLDCIMLGPLARLMGKPILFNPLVTLTDTLIDDRMRVAPHGVVARLVRLIDRLSLRLASTVITDTAQNRDFLETTFGLPRSKVDVVPVGADDLVFRPEPEEERDPAGCGLRVLFYGNMIPLQGVETIVRAAHLLRDEEDITFDIVGSGQTLDSVRSLARTLDVKNVTFSPRLPYEQLPSAIAQSDVLLGIFGDTDKAARVVPNKVYQAMAMGAVIITRDSSAAREMLRDGESALLIPPADPESLAAAISRMRDAAFRQRLGTAARERYLTAASLHVQTAILDRIVTNLLGEPATVRGEVAA